MDASTIDLFIYGYFLAALFHSAFALALLRADALRKTNRRASLLFTGAVVATALWAWSGAASAYWPEASVFINSLFDLVRYGLWFLFLLALLKPATRPKERSAISMLAPVGWALIGIGIVVLFVVHPDTRSDTKVSRLVLFSSLTLPVFGVILIEQLFRNLDDDARWNAKPLCLGLSIVFFFDLYLYARAVLFGGVDNDAANIRGGIHALSVPLLFMGLRRRADWISKLQISRAAAFYSASLLAAGAYLLFIAAIGYYVRFSGGEWGSALQVATLFVALILFAVLVFSGSMRARLRVFVGKNFFSYRYDYREEWLRFTSILSTTDSPQEMGVRVIKGLANLLESPAGGLWIRGPDADRLVQAARWNMPALEANEPVASPLSQFLSSKGWVIDVEQYRSTPERYDPLILPAWILSRPQFWLVVPLALSDELIGFVTLDRPRTPVDVNWEVTDLLKTASRQAASFLAQMRATEALLEARKFDAFNRMSAFVVHDLKNIVTQLSLMMKNAQRLRDNPEFQQDMLTTVENSLEKMRQLMLQLREGEAPPSGRSGVDLLPIIRRIEAVATERGRTLEVQVTEKVITRGHEQRIERVLGHVVQNALDATTPSDRVWLRLERSSGQAQLVVGDTGHGMSEEYVRTRLFKPFQTTKETGMGIGAYESLQYIRELGGNIAVDTKVNRGTVMTIVLPLFEARPASDLQMISAK